QRGVLPEIPRREPAAQVRHAHVLARRGRGRARAARAALRALLRALRRAEGGSVSEPSYETILFDVREQVATVTLNRPDVRNALGAGMGPELDAAFRRGDEDDAIRAVVLPGTPPAFCSGADLVRGGETFGKVDPTTFNAAGLRFPPWD